MTARHARRLDAATRIAAAAATAALSACVSVDFDRHLQHTNKVAHGFTDGHLSLTTSAQEHAAQHSAAQALLQRELTQRDAVHLALVNSPAFQVMLAQSWSQAQKAAQDGRMANPVLSLERLHSAEAWEWDRTLSFGLLELLTWPQRQKLAQHRIDQTQLQLTLQVIDRVTQVRQAWVLAVGAQEMVRYAQQVVHSTQAGVTLAQRMRAAGNFSKLDDMRQQAFQAQATTQLASAQQQAQRTRETLVRALGLRNDQAEQLQLPPRLPDLPDSPLSTEVVSDMASQQRLDVKLAQSVLETALQAQGLTFVTSLSDVEAGVAHNTSTLRANHERSVSRGAQVSLRLPLFDWGEAQRSAMNAQSLAAAQALEDTARMAGSHLREHYGAYRTAYDIAQHHRQTVLPLYQAIADENLLRYNGMFIDVFALLADARTRISAVMATLQAQQQFWLSDAALQATLIGQPRLLPSSSPPLLGQGGGMSDDKDPH